MLQPSFADMELIQQSAIIALRRKMKVSIEFVKEDLWVGVYWRYDHAYYNMRHIYICIIPCFPIHITL